MAIKASSKAIFISLILQVGLPTLFSSYKGSMMTSLGCGGNSWVKFKTYILPVRVVNDGFGGILTGVLDKLWPVSDYFLGHVVHFKPIKFKETNQELSSAQILVVRRVLFVHWHSHLFVLDESDDHQEKGITAQSSVVRGEKFRFVNEFFQNQYQILSFRVNLQVIFD